MTNRCAISCHPRRLIEGERADDEQQRKTIELRYVSSRPETGIRRRSGSVDADCPATAQRPRNRPSYVALNNIMDPPTPHVTAGIVDDPRRHHA